MSKPLLSGLKASFIPLKMDPYKLEQAKKDLERLGGVCCQNQADAHIVLTILTSASRTKRHLLNHQVPVVGIEWLKECVNTQTKVPMDKYKIIVPRRNDNGSASLKQDDNLQSQREDGILYRHFANRAPDTLPPDDRDTNKGKSSGSGATQLPSGFKNTRYTCLRETPLEPYRNKRLVSLLRLLEKQRRLIDMSQGRSLAYRRAVAAIKAYPHSIRSVSEATRITGIGKKIGEHIGIYLAKGTIPVAAALLSDSKFRTLDHFCKVFGVGPSTAHMWWDQGYRTLDEVRRHARLTASMKLAIELLPELGQPMNREDAKEVIEVIKKEIVYVDRDAFAMPVGGYRRGKKYCGDLDIIISCGNLKHNHDNLLTRIIEHMEERGHVKHRFLLSDKSTNYHGKRLTTGGADMDKLDTCFTAFLQPSKKVLRQVDFVVASKAEYPAAVLAWTGSRQFERDLRDYAKKEKGLSVKAHGIFEEATGKQLKIESEEHAFRLLGIPYIEPNMRNS
ncbi:hypothetical protein BJV82DRAFT_585666 [Fennellomyces sp. T-0311]|nr:hypothetical protein BJV82DRAFT_585666 [Fennellomyces sp. T-0311]